MGEKDEGVVENDSGQFQVRILGQKTHHHSSSHGVSEDKQRKVLSHFGQHREEIVLKVFQSASVSLSRRIPMSLVVIEVDEETLVCEGLGSLHVTGGMLGRSMDENY